MRRSRCLNSVSQRFVWCLDHLEYTSSSCPRPALPHRASTLLHLSLLLNTTARYRSHWRPIEDTKPERRLRRRRAMEAAIGLNSMSDKSPASGVSNPAHYYYHQLNFRRRCMFQVDVPARPPRHLLVSTDDRASMVVLESTTKPLPHAPPPERGPGSKLCCPLLRAHLPTPPSSIPPMKPRRRGPRKRRSGSTKERPQPTFFRPDEGWGGKSAGYAMGWVSSHPAPTWRNRTYRRDHMKSGIESLPCYVSDSTP